MVFLLKNTCNLFTVIVKDFVVVDFEYISHTDVKVFISALEICIFRTLRNIDDVAFFRIDNG